jgi:hypothetical protein
MTLVAPCGCFCRDFVIVNKRVINLQVSDTHMDVYSFSPGGAEQVCVAVMFWSSIPDVKIKLSL